MRRDPQGGTWLRRAMAAMTAVAFLFLLAPLLLVLLFSFTNSPSPALPIHSLTLRWCAETLSDERFRQVTLNSLYLGLLVAAISTLLGTLGGFALARYRFPGRRLVQALSMLPVVTPWLLLALGLLVTLVSLNIRPSFAAVAIGHVTIALPFALIIVTTRMTTFDRRLEDASRDLGAGWWTTFRHVVLPHLNPALRAVFFLSFILSFNEVIMAFFLAGNSATLPIYMYQYFMRVIRPTMYAMSGLMVALAAVALFFEQYIGAALATARQRGRGAN